MAFVRCSPIPFRRGGYCGGLSWTLPKLARLASIGLLAGLFLYGEHLDAQRPEQPIGELRFIVDIHIPEFRLLSAF